jgi:tetratricopeptide (TPR) repeat protein
VTTIKMKMTFVLIVLVLGSIHPVHTTEPIKVLTDESRIQIVEDPAQWMVDLMKAFGFEYEKIEDPRYSFENTKEEFGFGTAAERLRSEFSVNIKKSGEINYSNLRNYDVLVITSFSRSYSSGEAEAIHQFVENGGGLFFSAHYDSSNNSVSLIFDVLFPSEGIRILDQSKKSDNYRRIYLDEFESHPITEGVNQILLDDGVPITRFESGEVLARTSETSWAESDSHLYVKDKEEKEGPFDVILVQSVGKGRTVFFGGSDSFCNFTVEKEDQENLDFFVNAIRWLGEPGGPYKQYKERNQQAQLLMVDAKSLCDDHKFSEAASKFEDVIVLYTESDEIYDNPEAEQGILEAEMFIEYCEKGMEADILFDEALKLYQERELEEAVSKFESAQSLYQEIGYEARVLECTSQVEECQRLMSVWEEAARLFNEGRTTLEEGSSAVSTAGYEKAKSLFEEARSNWQEYGDEVKAAECDEKISECERGVSVVNRTRVVLAVVAIVIASSGMAVILKMRKTSNPG